MGMTTYSSDDDSGRCGLENKDNATSPIGLKNPYGGIPQNLIFNSVILFALIVAFLVVRKSAFKLAGRLVPTEGLSKWTGVFFSFTQDVVVGAGRKVVNSINIGNNGGNGAKREDGAGDGNVEGRNIRTIPEDKQLLPDADADAVAAASANQVEAREEADVGGGGDAPQKADGIEAAPASPLRASVNFDLGAVSADPEAGGPPSPPADDTDEDLAASLGFEGSEVVVERQNSREEGEAAARTASSRRRLQRQFTLTNKDLTFSGWLKSIFVMKDEEIADRCGDDALQYLRYQRHVIFYLVIVVVLVIGVVLPLNFQGDLQGDQTSFEHTTLVNLDPNSPYLWAHATLAFLFFPLAVVVMRRFSKGVKFQEVSLDLRKTLMIEKVPRYLCRARELRQHFREAYDGRMKIRTIHFAYDVERLLEVNQELKNATLAKDYVEDRNSKEDPAMTLQPQHCARCCSCFCCCCGPRVDALEYYSEQESDLRRELDRETEKALGTPLGIAFVTFKSINMAKRVCDSFKRGSVFQCGFVPPESSQSDKLKIKDWKVTFASTPDDLHWENLSLESRFLLLKAAAFNVLLFLVAFFLTTPEYIISQTDFLVEYLGDGGLNISSVVVDFLPTLMLWSFTALLPLLVAWSDRFLGHWTKSAENHNIMKKTFWFLLFMVVILPTFGFGTADAVVKFILDNNSTESYRWECVFLPDSGAFFVNYIITASLTGAGLELIRFPDLIFYLVKTCYSKSSADTPAIRENLKLEFRFGEQYARMALIFCMTMMFSLSCPLITPFGLLFFVTKHFVDRHNILYAYKPSKINKKVHSTAISFVILGVVVLQFFMLVYSYIRGGVPGEPNKISNLTKAMMGVFFVSVNVFSAQLWAETCKKFSAIEYVECTYIRDDVDTNEYVYLPDELMASFDGPGRGRMVRAVEGGAGESFDDGGEEDEESLPPPPTGAGTSSSAEYGSIRQNQTAEKK